MTHKNFRPKDYDTFIGIDVDKSSFFKLVLEKMYKIS